MSQLIADTGHHVITDIRAYHTDKGDNQCLPDIVKRLRLKLNLFGLLWRNWLADTGYSCGENYAFLERINLLRSIPFFALLKRG
jgi:hypothetical protein